MFHLVADEEHKYQNWKLEKLIATNATEDGLSEYERAKRDVKEEAQETQVNIDILHEKAGNAGSIRTISLILGRFHVHKGQPKLAAPLILKLVSTID